MLELVALPAFSDNYIWLLHNGSQALVVDPGDAEPVKAALLRRGLSLKAILVTHHHSDHVGGVDALRPLLQGQVYAPAAEKTPQPHMPVQGGQVLSELDCEIRVMDVPGHTAGHIAFVVQPRDQAQPPILFCGDTLFSGGCGRLFEGTAEQMHRSLMTLAELPGSTQVCCAHEYTMSNLRFALQVEPANEQLQAYRDQCQALREKQLPTLPSTIQTERQINPFMRCHIKDVAHSAGQHGARSQEPIEVLRALREWKNRA